MKKPTFALIAILLFIIVSCTKQSNRIGNTPIEYGTIVPHLDSASVTSTSAILYNASFDNYAEFETIDISGTIVERGLLWCNCGSSITLENTTTDTSTVIVPTVSSPYIPTATQLFRSSIPSSNLYYFRYYAKLNNGIIVYSGICRYAHP
jgi:hypothetical protein